MSTTADADYTVTDYLLDRLAEAGVDRLFGVPGDFTLGMLDRVEAHTGVEWIGCGNELGAGYAADGYARVRGLGAVFTTFGVGELSALNAVAGAAAERVPLLHVVGAPSSSTQVAGRATHHTLGDGDFRHFARMTAEVTAVQALVNADDATAEIDRVISEVRERRMPGYLLIPMDVGASSAAPPAAPLPTRTGITDPRELAEFTEAARAILATAQNPALIADVLVERMGGRAQLDALLATGIPHATLLWGRHVVDETAPGFVGTYIGDVSPEPLLDTIDGADVLILAGVQFTELTSGFFSQRFGTANVIDVGPRGTAIGGRRFTPIALPDALAALNGLIPTPAEPIRRPRPAIPTPPAPDAPLTQSAMWDVVAAQLRDGDLVVADQGTPFFGMGAHSFPRDVLAIAQPLWASIGYGLPAGLGAALAAPERRPLVLIGDGAAQLTIAELGTLLRYRVPATILLVDNAGYTIERTIRGETAVYNDIQLWDWQALPAALGGGRGVKVTTVGELQAALAGAGEELLLIQAVVAPLDVPDLLKAFSAQAAAASRPPVV
ncbi:alpha-keto acid decarboxylase family protein [Pseudolysinimonas sp.]|uniref:alpha-keto acid decarboxylase family protein n=1 Tax=Pseudolysinimonas sp. TaxID=2680009 RepID=UPI003F7F67D0